MKEPAHARDGCDSFPDTGDVSVVFFFAFSSGMNFSSDTNLCANRRTALCFVKGVLGPTSRSWLDRVAWMRGFCDTRGKRSLGPNGQILFVYQPNFPGRYFEFLLARREGRGTSASRSRKAGGQGDGITLWCGRATLFDTGHRSGGTGRAELIRGRRSAESRL
jgi:hypothetical protein